MCSYGDVPEDVMVSIFERLPIKSLLRFRSVSKSWYSRIASPDFIRNYPIRSDQKVLIRHFIMVTNVNCIDMYTLYSPSGYIKPGVELEHCYNQETVGSCNGIICLLDLGISLWNFSIRRKLTLPRHPSLKDVNYNRNAAFGFGFDPVTDDYKIVAISYFKYIDGVAYNEDSFIYSLKTNSWDSISSPTTTPFIKEALPKACFFNGTLHWLVIGLVNEPPTETSFIMTFNLCTHAFGTISLPISFWQTTPITGSSFSWHMRQITTINGSLAVVFLQGGYNTIWVMSEYDNAKSWSVYLKVKHTYDGFTPARFLQPINNGKILIYDYHRLQVYNPQTGLVTEILKFRHNCHRVRENYVESLELLDKGTTSGETIFSWIEKHNQERISVSELLENEYSGLSYNF